MEFRPLHKRGSNRRSAELTTASSGVATGVRGGAGRTGRHLLGAAKGRKRRKCKKNCVKIQIVSFMCLRARKTKRYGQRVPIVTYQLSAN